MPLLLAHAMLLREWLYACWRVCAARVVRRTCLIDACLDVCGRVYIHLCVAACVYV